MLVSETPSEDITFIVRLLTFIFSLGAGIIGVCTAYYLTRHPDFSPDTHHITIMEARRPAGGASGKAGGLIAMWAFPQQIVPLSFQLHQELAEEYNGSVEWGYRGLETLCIEGNISASNLRNIANQIQKKKRDAALPEELDWINTDIIDGWAHLGDADSTAQVHPYKFTLFMLKKVLETGAVDLVTGKVTEVLMNGDGKAAGVRYTTSTGKRHNGHHQYQHQHQHANRFSSGRKSTSVNKNSLHHPDNPTFNTNTKSLHTPSHSASANDLTPTPTPSKAEDDSPEPPATSDFPKPATTSQSDESAQPVNAFKNIHNRDFPSSSMASSSSISESSECSSSLSTDDESAMSDSGSALDLDLNESDDLTTDSLAEALSAEESKESDKEENENEADTGHIASLYGDQIVLTLGPWTSKVLPSCPISGLRAHSITIQPTKSVSPYALFTEMRTSRTSYVSPEIYPRKDEVYVCGEGDTFADVPETTDDVEVLRDKCDELFKLVGEISPQLKDGRILKRQACYLPVVDVPSHSGPFIGNTNIDNLYLASGHSCWGINNAPATGLLMAEILLDGEATSASVDGLEPEFYFDASASLQ